MGFKDFLNKDKVVNTTIVILTTIGILCVGYVLFSYFGKKVQIGRIGNMDCVKGTTQMTITDTFMEGVFSKDQSVPFYENFYNCNPVKRDEIVAFRFSEQIPPVARWVRGIPGDKYTLAEDTEKKGRWTISINGAVVKNGDTPYYIESNSVPPLKTYELSRGGVLLPDEHIVLGNVSPSISDSSNLGLVKKKDLIGKLVR